MTMTVLCGPDGPASTPQPFDLWAGPPMNATVEAARKMAAVSSRREAIVHVRNAIFDLAQDGNITTKTVARLARPSSRLRPTRTSGVFSAIKRI
jgi:hypothetical protein